MNALAAVAAHQHLDYIHLESSRKRVAHLEQTTGLRVRLASFIAWFTGPIEPIQVPQLRNYPYYG